MLILPDEWILDYLTPGTDKSGLSDAFIAECKRRQHLLLIRRNGNFRSKLFRYSKLYSVNPAIRRFVSLVLRDFQLVRIIEEQEVTQQGVDLSAVPQDDRYLAEVLLAFPTAVLITTDEFLNAQLAILGLRSVLFRDNVTEALRVAEAFEQIP